MIGHHFIEEMRRKARKFFRQCRNSELLGNIRKNTSLGKVLALGAGVLLLLLVCRAIFARRRA